MNAPAEQSRGDQGNGQTAAPMNEHAETQGLQGGGRHTKTKPAPAGLRLVVLPVVIIVAAAAGALLINFVRPPVYGAEAQILYRVADDSGARAERELATQQVILRGRTVLQPVAAEVGMSVEELQDRVSVEVVGGSDVLRLTAGDPDAGVAVEVAQAIAENYVAAREEVAAANQDEAAALVEEQIAEVSEALAGVEDELAAAAGAPEEPMTAEEERLADEAEALQRRLETLQDRLASLQLAPPTQEAQVRILTPAYVLEEPLSPGPLQAGAAGMMVGVLVAAMLVAVQLHRGGYFRDGLLND